MIYVDNASTTKMPDAVIAELLPFLNVHYGNPSAPNTAGVSAYNAVCSARKRLASLIGAEEKEIIFTSGGSEANNQALLTMKKYGEKSGKKTIIISAIEHDSVYKTAKKFEKDGFKILIADVDEKGFVSEDRLASLLIEDVCGISIMTANNEIGTIQPIDAIGKLCRERGILFHTDAVQAVGHIEIDVKKLNADMLSLSAHKFGGMKGVGALYVRDGISAESVIIGGKQEENRRAGTENAAGIIAMSKALEISLENLDEKQKYILSLRNRLAKRLANIPDSRINGSLENRLCGNLNISFKSIDSEAILLLLDQAGICASQGAACHTGIAEPSRVLTSLGVRPDYSLGTVRFSLSEYNTEEEIDFIAETMEKAIYKLR